MVRGLFPCAEQDAVMALVESSVVFLTPGYNEEVLREAKWPRSAWIDARRFPGNVWRA